MQSFNINQQNKNALPSTLSEFHDFAAGDIKSAINLAMQHPHIANLLTFDYFYDMTCFDQHYALALSVIPSLNKIIDTPEKFIKICREDFDIAHSLVKHHSHIAEIARPHIPFMPYYYFKHDKPRVRNKALTSPSLAALDLAERTTTIDARAHQSSVFERMTLEKFDIARASQVFLRHFPSVKKYCNQMMYGPSGYYATGKVDFNNHFVTLASQPDEVPGFSATLAYQLFHVRKKLINEHKLRENENFNILECGGGNGDLCYNILEIISKMAQINLEWKQFFESIRYHLVEVSPELVKRQTTRNQKFGSRVSIVHGDARTLSTSLAGNKIAVALSNELLDMFAPQEIFLTKEGHLSVGVMVPFINKSYFNSYFKQLLNQANLKLDKLMQESEKYKNHFILLTPDSHKAALKKGVEDFLLLSEKSFLKLHKIASKEKTCPDLFNFMNTHIIDAEYIPELSDYLKENRNFTDRMRVEEVRFVDVGIHQYLQSIYNLLMPGAEVITFDYGDNDYLALDRLITVSNGKKGIDIRDQPGFIDITKHVNFTTLATAGDKLSLKTVFYGTQDQLNMGHFPANVLSSSAAMIYKMVLESKSDFKVLIQRKTDDCYPISNSDAAARYIGESKPVRHSQLFMTMQNKQKEIMPVSLKSLLAKYKLIDSTQASLECGLRNAAVKNNPEDLKSFIKLVKNINAQDSNPSIKRSALHWAALKGNIECCQLLLDAGAQACLTDVNNTMALKHLSSFCQPEIDITKIAEVKLLLAKYSLPDCAQASLEKGLRNAATNNHLDNLKILINLVKNLDAQDSNPKVKRTALHWAAIKKHDDCYELLLQAGANANIPDFNEQTASEINQPSQNRPQPVK